MWSHLETELYIYNTRPVWHSTPSCPVVCRAHSECLVTHGASGVTERREVTPRDSTHDSRQNVRSQKVTAPPSTQDHSHSTSRKTTGSRHSAQKSGAAVSHEPCRMCARRETRQAPYISVSVRTCVGVTLR